MKVQADSTLIQNKKFLNNCKSAWCAYEVQYVMWMLWVTTDVLQYSLHRPETEIRSTAYLVMVNAQIIKKSSARRRKCKTLQNDRSLRKKTFSWKRFAEYKISCCFHWPSLYQLSCCTNFVASLYFTHRLYIKDSCCEVTLYLHFNRNHNVQHKQNAVLVMTGNSQLSRSSNTRQLYPEDTPTASKKTLQIRKIRQSFKWKSLVALKEIARKIS